MTYQADNITSIPAPTPSDYDRQFSFLDWERNNPGVPYPAAGLEAEFNAIERTTDETQARLRLIQRDDGALANGSVGLDQLSVEARIGVEPPTTWTEFTSYTAGNSVIYNNIAWYVAAESHVSSDDFTADLGAGKWILLLDFSAFYTTEAQHWADYPEDQLVPEGNLVDDYSALHWAAKAETDAVTASDAATAAAASAATLNLPAPTETDKVLTGNGTDGFVFGPTFTASITGGAIPVRTGGGRLTSIDPVNSSEVVTLSYLQARDSLLTDQISDLGDARNARLMEKITTADFPSGLTGAPSIDVNESNALTEAHFNRDVWFDTRCHQVLTMSDAVNDAAGEGTSIRVTTSGGTVELDMSGSSVQLAYTPNSHGVPVFTSVLGVPYGEITLTKRGGVWFVTGDKARAAEALEDFTVPDARGEDVAGGGGPWTATTTVTAYQNGETGSVVTDGGLYTQERISRWWSTPAAPGADEAPSGLEVRLTAENAAGSAMVTGALSEGLWYALTSDRVYNFEEATPAGSTPVATVTGDFTMEIRYAGGDIVARSAFSVDLITGDPFA